MINHVSLMRGMLAVHVAILLVSGPVEVLFPDEAWAKVAGFRTLWLSGGEKAAGWLVAIVFAVMVASYLPPLLVDLGSGMARLSNTAMVMHCPSSWCAFSYVFAWSEACGRRCSMLIGKAVDTLLNLATFAFVAAMIWLLVRP